jgi:hypothetical protein
MSYAKVEVTFTLEQVMKALDGGGWLTSRPSRFIPKKDSGTHCTGGGVGTGQVWTDAEILGHTGI